MMKQKTGFGTKIKCVVTTRRSAEMYFTTHKSDEAGPNIRIMPLRRHKAMRVRSY